MIERTMERIGCLLVQQRSSLYLLGASRAVTRTPPPKGAFLFGRSAQLRTTTTTTTASSKVALLQQERSSSSPSFSSRSNGDKATTRNDDVVRLSKVLAANCSISRNEAERWIRQGLVTVAGRTVVRSSSTANWSDLQNGALQACGKAVQLRVNPATKHSDGDDGSSSSTAAADSQQQVWLVHKLAGEMVADLDPHGRPCLMERLLSRGLLGRRRSKKKKKQHFKAIGRLDMGTEGLILVTTDGQYAREMELPSNQLHRTYRVRVHGRLSDYKLQRIGRRGSFLTIGNVRYAPMKVTVDDDDDHYDRSRKQRRSGRRRASATSTNTWLQVTCSEGKNRQIRNVFAHFGLTVTRLIRISYGDYQLKTIPAGMAIPVPRKPVQSQKRRGPLFPNRRRQRQEEATSNNNHLVSPPIQWKKSLW